MRRKRILRYMSALVCLLLLLCAGTLPASANSAPAMWWNGSEASGPVAGDLGCPLSVESEVLTFEVAEFPAPPYEEVDDFLAYSGSVTAAYTLYNPTGQAITARLYFPFGHRPEYADTFIDVTSGRTDTADDTAEYDITLNGTAVEKRLRYTYQPIFGDFNVETHLPYLCDDYAQDVFFTPDMPVYKHVYRVGGVGATTAPSQYLAFTIPFGLANNRILVEHGGTEQLADGRWRVYLYNGYEEEDLVLYVIGEQDVVFDWEVYGDRDMRQEIEGEVILQSSEQITFEQLALSYRDTASEVSDIDWYNATVQYFNDQGTESGWLSTPYIERYLMRWYAYDITVAAGERVVNTVSAPVYPGVDEGYDPYIYDYTYLLSPAERWASFGSLEIIVNTPYYMTKSGVGRFEKTETGYRLMLNGLPEEELTFTLCTVANPRFEVSPVWVIFIALVVICVLIAVSLPVAGIVVAIILVRRRKKKRQA